MVKRQRGGLSRLFGRDDEVGDDEDDETVPLAGSDDHAWWADRRSLSGAPVSAQTTEPDEEPRPDPWSAEALFADAGFDPATPPPPPPRDDGATMALVETGLDEARLLLGVHRSADWDLVNQAHRQLALQFHPDRLVGLSAEAQALGQERMAEINRAYDVLRNHMQP